MPMATALWLVENTTLTFKQIRLARFNRKKESAAPCAKETLQLVHCLHRSEGNPKACLDIIESYNLCTEQAADNKRLSKSDINRQFYRFLKVLIFFFS